MNSLNHIKEFEFSYFDCNNFVYNFYVLEATSIKNNEISYDMLCKETNTSANGAISFTLSLKDEKLLCKTDYFANSFEWIALEEDVKSSSAHQKIFFKIFNDDKLEVRISI